MINVISYKTKKKKKKSLNEIDIDSSMIRKNNLQAFVNENRCSLAGTKWMHKGWISRCPGNVRGKRPH